MKWIKAKNGEKASDHLPINLRYIHEGHILKDIFITENIHTIEVYIGMKGGGRLRQIGDEIKDKRLDTS